MNKYNLFFYLLIVILFIGCKSEKDEVLENFLARNSLNKLDNRAVVIVPLEGCTPCIQKTISFSRDFSHPNLTFIIEPFGSKKNVTMRYTLEEIEANNIIIDKFSNKK